MLLGLIFAPATPYHFCKHETGNEMGMKSQCVLSGDVKAMLTFLFFKRVIGILDLCQICDPQCRREKDF